MSYSAVGSYYTVTPGQIYPQSMGALVGFGSVAAEFSAESVWADVQIGGSCYAPGVTADAALLAKCNAAGSRATKMIEAALNELGYGPVPIDGNWGSAKPKWQQFMSQHGLSTSVGEIQKNGLVLMEQLLKQGATPGPNKPTEYDKVGGEYIPSTEDKQAGVGLGLLAVLAAVGIAGVAIARSRKKKGATSPRLPPPRLRPALPARV